MSGNVFGAAYWLGDILARGRVREAVPVMTELLNDPDVRVRNSAALSLIALGTADPELRE